MLAAFAIESDQGLSEDQLDVLLVSPRKPASAVDVAVTILLDDANGCLKKALLTLIGVRAE